MAVDVAMFAQRQGCHAQAFDAGDMLRDGAVPVAVGVGAVSVKGNESHWFHFDSPK